MSPNESFLRDKHEHVNTLQFFVPKGTVLPENQQENKAEEKAGDEGDITVCKSGLHHNPEMIRLMNFIEEHNHAHEFGLDKWLEEKGVTAYVMQHGGLPREKTTSHSRMHA